MSNVSTVLHKMSRDLECLRDSATAITKCLQGTPTDARLAAVREYANGLPDSVGVIRRDLLALVDGGDQ